MIPANAITAWSVTRPWPTRAAIEQDLLLARTIVAIYDDAYLAKELVFRGGTCLHQLHLPTPLRYSEDLDFVRRTHTGIGEIFDRLRDVAAKLGLTVHNVVVGEHPKMRLRASAEDNPDLFLTIKVEINTHETSPALPLITMPFTVDSPWFTGTVDVLTFQTAELVATKIRALYQRSKGRDIFDLWLALDNMKVPSATIRQAFAPYRPDGWTPTLAIANLNAKLANQGFRHDLDPLVTAWPPEYDIDGAADLIRSELIEQL